MHKIVFHRGSAPDLAGGSYSCLIPSPRWFKGAYFYKEKGKGGEGKGKGRDREGSGRDFPPYAFLDPSVHLLYANSVKLCYIIYRKNIHKPRNIKTTQKRKVFGRMLRESLKLSLASDRFSWQTELRAAADDRQIVSYCKSRQSASASPCGPPAPPAVPNQQHVVASPHSTSIALMQKRRPRYIMRMAEPGGAGKGASAHCTTHLKHRLCRVLSENEN